MEFELRVFATSRQDAGQKVLRMDVDVTASSKRPLASAALVRSSSPAVVRSRDVARPRGPRTNIHDSAGPNRR